MTGHIRVAGGAASGVESGLNTVKGLKAGRVWCARSWAPSLMAVYAGVVLVTVAAVGQSCACLNAVCGLPIYEMILG